MGLTLFTFHAKRFILGIPNSYSWEWESWYVGRDVHCNAVVFRCGIWIIHQVDPPWRWPALKAKLVKPDFKLDGHEKMDMVCTQCMRMFPSIHLNYEPPDNPGGIWNISWEKIIRVVSCISISRDWSIELAVGLALLKDILTRIFHVENFWHWLGESLSLEFVFYLFIGWPQKDGYRLYTIHANVPIRPSKWWVPRHPLIVHGNYKCLYVKYSWEKIIGFVYCISI